METQKQTLEELFSQRAIWFARTHQTFASRNLNSSLSLGLSEIDNHLPEGGLARGAIHEWFLDLNLPFSKKQQWLPPLALIVGMIGQLKESCPPFRVVWIGKKCWPALPALAGLQRKLPQWERYHIFIDPPSKSYRLWSIIKALQSRAISVVVADGSMLNITETRRIQLAASHNRTIGCVLRPLWEIQIPSVAYTRWKASPLISPQEEPRWILELIRSKGGAKPQHWTIEQTSHENNPFCVLPQLGIRDSKFSETPPHSHKQHALGG